MGSSLNADSFTSWCFLRKHRDAFRCSLVSPHTAWARSHLISKEITARGPERIWLCSLFIGSALHYWYFKIRSLLVPRVIKPKFRDASVISHPICLEEFAHRGEMLNLKWWAFRFWKTTKTLTGRCRNVTVQLQRKAFCHRCSLFCMPSFAKTTSRPTVLLHTWPNESLMEYK